MRKNMITAESNGYKIIVVDDEQGIVDSLSIFLKRSGYDFTGLTNPLEAIGWMAIPYRRPSDNRTTCSPLCRWPYIPAPLPITAPAIKPASSER